MLCWGVAAILAAGNGAAEAATRTATFSISVTITAGCTTTVSSPAFGSRELRVARPAPASAFTVTCTQPAPYSVGWEGDPQFSQGNLATRQSRDDATIRATVTY